MYLEDLPRPMLDKYKEDKKRALNNKSVPWISYDLRNLIKEKHKLCYKRNKSSSVAEYRRICQEVKCEIKSARLDNERKLKIKKEPKLIYKYMNRTK